jgi:osmotically-inducible protein OsmY
MPADPDEPIAYVVGRLEEAFAHDPRINELNVDVTVAGRKVYLTGRVPTRERQQAITEVARELLPDHEVHNQTSLYCLSEASSVENLT